MTRVVQGTIASPSPIASQKPNEWGTLVDAISGIMNTSKGSAPSGMSPEEMSTVVKFKDKLNELEAAHRQGKLSATELNTYTDDLELQFQARMADAGAHRGFNAIGAAADDFREEKGVDFHKKENVAKSNFIIENGLTDGTPLANAMWEQEKRNSIRAASVAATLESEKYGMSSLAVTTDPQGRDMVITTQQPKVGLAMQSVRTIATPEKVREATGDVEKSTALLTEMRQSVEQHKLAVQNDVARYGSLGKEQLDEMFVAPTGFIGQVERILNGNAKLETLKKVGENNAIFAQYKQNETPMQAIFTAQQQLNPDLMQKMVLQGIIKGEVGNKFMEEFTNHIGGLMSTEGEGDYKPKPPPVRPVPEHLSEQEKANLAKENLQMVQASMKMIQSADTKTKEGRDIVVNYMAGIGEVQATDPNVKLFLGELNKQMAQSNWGELLKVNNPEAYNKVVDLNQEFLTTNVRFSKYDTPKGTRIVMTGSSEKDYQIELIADTVLPSGFRSTTSTFGLVTSDLDKKVAKWNNTWGSRINTTLRGHGALTGNTLESLIRAAGIPSVGESPTHSKEDLSFFEEVSKFLGESIDEVAGYFNDN